MDWLGQLSRFEEWVTAFRRNVIGNARIRLTAYYVGVLVVVVLLVDAIVNYSRTFQFERRLVNLIPNADMLSDITRTVQQTVQDIRNIDFAIYAVLIALFGFVSYKIAGRTLAPIETMLASQRRFLANAAHELRTPLSIITSDIEVRLKDPAPTTPETMRAELVSIQEEVSRMSETINNLLLIAHAYHNKKPNFTTIDCTSVLAQACEIVRPFAEQTNITLKIEKNIPIVHVRGNKTALEQIFVNLLKNAIKYTHTGGTVSVGISTGKRHAYVRINDTGVGIPQTLLEEVFEPFFRVHTVHNAEGSGLGLTLVKELIALHKGSIELTSIEGKGTSALVTFPRV